MTTKPKKRKGKYRQVLQQMSISNSLSVHEGLLDLYTEVEQWRDNLTGTNLENSSKYEALDTACDVFEDHVQNVQDFVETLQNEVPEEVLQQEIEVAEMVVRRKRQYASRATRLMNTLNSLTAGREHILNWFEDLEEVPEGFDREKVEEVLNDLENSLAELEQVELPGMYG